MEVSSFAFYIHTDVISFLHYPHPHFPHQSQVVRRLAAGLGDAGCGRCEGERMLRVVAQIADIVARCVRQGELRIVGIGQ